MLAWCQTHQFNINHFFFTDSVLLYSFFWMSYLGYTKYFLTEAFFGNFFCFYCIFFAIILVFNICFMQHFNLRSKIKMITWQQTLLEFGENLIFMFFFPFCCRINKFSFKFDNIDNFQLRFTSKKNGNFEMPYFNLGSNFYTKKLFYDFSKL